MAFGYQISKKMTIISKFLMQDCFIFWSKGLAAAFAQPCNALEPSTHHAGSSITLCAFIYGTTKGVFLKWRQQSRERAWAELVEVSERFCNSPLTKNGTPRILNHPFGPRKQSIQLGPTGVFSPIPNFFPFSLQ
jgi:hypothetical protein